MKKICDIEKNQFVSNEEMKDVVGGVCPGNQAYYESCSNFSNTCLNNYWTCKKYLFCDVNAPSYMDCPHFVTQCMPIPMYTTCSVQNGYDVEMV